MIVDTIKENLCVNKKIATKKEQKSLRDEK